MVGSPHRLKPHPRDTPAAADAVAQAAEPFERQDKANLRPLLERIGDARIVLIGESSHGTAEFYEMRARITRELIALKGFRIVAAEADWPDARQIDRWFGHTNLRTTCRMALSPDNYTSRE